MKQPTPEEVQQRIVTWARQTIVFAMNTRAIDLGKSTEDVAHIKFVGAEAHRLVEQWRKEVWDEATKPAELHQLVMPFVKKTLYWAKDHLA